MATVSLDECVNNASFFEMSYLSSLPIRTALEYAVENEKFKCNELTAEYIKDYAKRNGIEMIADENGFTGFYSRSGRLVTIDASGA